MFRGIFIQIYRQKDRKIDRIINRQIGVQIDRQGERQIDDLPAKQRKSERGCRDNLNDQSEIQSL